jgi:N-acylneuraminate cytidylyltransferase
VSVIAIIPARGGSQRIPRKNIKDFWGQPIIAYSIQKAQESGLFDHIVVSTDDDEISMIAEAYGAKVHRRDPALGVDEVGTQEVVKECLQAMGLTVEDYTHYACCIYATSPLMDVEDLRLGYHLAIGEIDETTFVLSAGYPELRDAGQFYWGSVTHFISGEPLIGCATRVIHVADERICDINTPEDWKRAMKMYARLDDA